MDFLTELLTLPEPTAAGAFFTIWFIGAIGGYCLGRAHANWIVLRDFIRANK